MGEHFTNPPFIPTGGKVLLAHLSLSTPGLAMPRGRYGDRDDRRLYPVPLRRRGSLGKRSERRPAYHRDLLRQASGNCP